jgi:hypothetical protein
MTDPTICDRGHLTTSRNVSVGDRSTTDEGVRDTLRSSNSAASGLCETVPLVAIKGTSTKSCLVGPLVPSNQCATGIPPAGVKRSLSSCSSFLEKATAS